MGGSIETLVNREYQYGFVTDIEAETIPRGEHLLLKSGSHAALIEQPDVVRARMTEFLRERVADYIASRVDPIRTPTGQTG